MNLDYQLTFHSYKSCSLSTRVLTMAFNYYKDHDSDWTIEMSLQFLDLQVSDRISGCASPALCLSTCIQKQITLVFIKSFFCLFIASLLVWHMKKKQKRDRNITWVMSILSQGILKKIKSILQVVCIAITSLSF